MLGDTPDVGDLWASPLPLSNERLAQVPFASGILR